MTGGSRIYLDNNADTPLRPEVIEYIQSVLPFSGNPSSWHQEGVKAFTLIEEVRKDLAFITGARPEDVFFTSGGTEANNHVLSPFLSVDGKYMVSALLVGATEHISVLEGHHFPLEKVKIIPVDYTGTIDLSRLEVMLQQEESPVLVSVQLANDETGVIQPIRAIADLVHKYASVLHCDAVQAFGRMPVDIRVLDVDFLTLSAHKNGGPQGVGAVISGSSRFQLPYRLIRGGTQERGLRGGTENVAAIAGLGELIRVMEIKSAHENQEFHRFKEICEQAIRDIVPEALILGEGKPRLSNTFSFMIPGYPMKDILFRFEQAGVALSAGGACLAGTPKRSHVIEAMGISEDFGDIAISVSLGWQITESDIEHFTSVCQHVLSAFADAKKNSTLNETGDWRAV